MTIHLIKQPPVFPDIKQYFALPHPYVESSICVWTAFVVAAVNLEYGTNCGGDLIILN